MAAYDKPAAEVSIDAARVRGLLDEQHPDLASLPLVEHASGWDNAIFRLGDRLAVRLPRRQMAADLVENEQRWLPQLAPRLPLPVPAPVRVGEPGRGYPWRWSVCPWLAGEPAARTPPADADAAARRLGDFLRALQQPAPPDAPHNPLRGVPLRNRDEAFRERVARLGDTVDGVRVGELWERSLAAPDWHGPPTWLHGDLHPANLIVSGGELTAVIDFGDVAAGDPATDLAIAWMLLPSGSRARFRAAAGGCDDATWQRARGWALALAIALLAHSADAPLLHGVGRHTLQEVLDDPDAG